MRKLTFCDCKDFSKEMSDTFQSIFVNDEYSTVSVIAMYNEAKEIIRELLILGYDMQMVEMFNPEYYGKDVPYIISISNCENNKVGELWCESFLRENGYLKESSDVAYIVDNCSSQVLKHIESSCVIEVNFNEEKKIIQKSLYEVNGKEVSREEFIKFHDAISDKYLDGIRDMLLTHCSIMDEINQMSRLLRL